MIYNMIKSLLNINHKIIFYSETYNDHLHIKKLLNFFVFKSDINVTYLSSDHNIEIDLKTISNNKINYFFIGKGILRTFLFPNLKSNLFVMSMTDLNTFFIKKSLNVKKYVYFFHSLNSTHRSYLEGAFDNYDIILVASDHHLNEIKKREKLKGLKSKKILKYGHYIIDEISYNAKQYKEQNQIIIAPTWGNSSIYENLPQSFFYALCETNKRIIFRLHSMSHEREKYFKINLNELKQKFTNVHLDYGNSSLKYLCESSMMISDWSGVAPEFSFATGRKCLFIETPPKIRNKNYNYLKLPIFEDYIRSEIGELFKINEINKIIDYINDGKYKINNRHKLIENHTFNKNKNFQNACNYLLSFF